MVVPAPALSPECDTTIPLIIVVCCNEVEIPVVELASDGAGAPAGARCGCWGGGSIDVDDKLVVTKFFADVTTVATAAAADGNTDTPEEDSGTADSAVSIMEAEGLIDVKLAIAVAELDKSADALVLSW